MIISQSNINMSSSRVYSNTATYSKTTSTSIDHATSHKEFKELYDYYSNTSEEEYYSGNGLGCNYSYARSDHTDKVNYDLIQTENKVQNLNQTNNTSIPNKIGSLKEQQLSLQQKICSSIVSYLQQFMLRSLFSQDYKTFHMSDSNSGTNSINTTTLDKNYLSLTSSEDYTTWTIKTNTVYGLTQSEHTTMSATGTVLTADGRDISFSLDVNLSREFTRYTKTSQIAQFDKILTDPLIINLDESPDYISDQHFYFDIKGDGDDKKHIKLSANQGFLSLDLNEDGIINNGTELFGTTTGDGFLDLSTYDKDLNGWIDEADEIYNKLKIWTIDEDGQSHLLTLKEADVGAIYLGKTKTDFSYTDENNTVNARLRASGMYLHENGTAGIVSQIDI